MKIKDDCKLNEISIVAIQASTELKVKESKFNNLITMKYKAHI